MKSLTETLTIKLMKEVLLVLFYLNRAPEYMSLVSVATVRSCDFELVDNSTSFPDLAPLTIICSRTRKKTLGLEPVSQ